MLNTNKIFLALLIIIFIPLVDLLALAEDRSLTVVSNGGAYTKSQVNAYHKPFTNQTGIKINSVDFIGGKINEVRDYFDSGRDDWDVISIQRADAISGCDEGILESIDTADLPSAPDGTPAIDDFLSGGILECAIATITFSVIYSYDSSVFTKNKPTTIADFFDIKKFPGKRGVRSTPRAILEMALLADGVNRNDIYNTLSTKSGLKRAFAKLSTIKDQIIWWNKGDEPEELLSDKKVVMTTAWNGRIFDAVMSRSRSFEIVWDGQIFDFAYWAILSNSKNKDITLDFIKFSTDTQRLADQASWISYGPARKSSISLIGKHVEHGIDMLPHMPNYPNNFKNAVKLDQEFWGANQDSVQRWFDDWLQEE